MLNDKEDRQLAGVPDFYKTWPASDIVNWPGPKVAELGKEVEEGGSWTGGKSFTMIYLCFSLWQEKRKKRRVDVTFEEKSTDDSFPI